MMMEPKNKKGHFSFRPAKFFTILTAALIVSAAGLTYTQEAQAMNSETARGTGRELCETINYTFSAAVTMVIDAKLTEVKDTEFTGYDVPLSIDLQRKIKIICDDYEIDMTLILAMIKYESSFDPGVMGDGQESFGLMQIQPKWHEDRMRRLGVTDLLDPEQNVRVGADLLSELLSKEKGTEWALMAYNGGEAFADRFAAQGSISDYASRVLEYREEILTYSQEEKEDNKF